MISNLNSLNIKRVISTHSAIFLIVNRDNIPQLNFFVTVSRCSRASGEDVRLMLWDTAGQEEFNAITKAYYRGAQVLQIKTENI